MKTRSSAWLVAALMCLSAIVGMAGKPSRKAENVINLDSTVPRQFGTWTEVRDQPTQIVNPQTKELLDKLYSQVLSRTYVNDSGYRIMLSMAYGDDQRGGLQAHRPEICYPAQGFKVLSNRDGAMPTPWGDIEVRRLQTNMGARVEPVTYWLTVGDHVIRNQFEKRMMEFRLSLTGQIPDGLLFRVSSIDPDADRAFVMQQRFAADMLSAVPAEARRQLSGLTGSGVS